MSRRPYGPGCRGSGVPQTEQVRRSGTFDAPHFGQIFAPWTELAGPAGGIHRESADDRSAREERRSARPVPAEVGPATGNAGGTNDGRGR